LSLGVSPERSGIAANIRQLIFDGKSKTALDNAKEFHKKQGSAESEILLIDAYLARIQSLFDQNFVVEAQSLIALVRQRFPSAKERLDHLNSAASARGGDLDELLKPLNDPGLSAERRAAIEQVIQNQVTDLVALAGCAALPPEHGLRQAAAAIDKAFGVVTSGPVTDQQIALPEVSHRSPLANWKLLIRAIACFYRNQDKACEDCLAAIRPESAPWRLVPTMRAMLGAHLGAQPGAKLAAKPAIDLKPAEAALKSRTSGSLGELQRALAGLDHAFAHAEQPAQVFKAVRAAVRECHQSAPDLLAELRQTICVRGEVACLDTQRMNVAAEGAPRRDAIFFRNLARALERTGDSEDLLRACVYWDCFRQEAVRDGWFAERGIEVAALYLHMAGLLGRMPAALLRDLRRPFGGTVSRESNYFYFPEELYARACLIDRHPDAFSQWLQWARGNSIVEAENVAHAWSKALPDAVEPLLFLMQEAEKRNAFPSALSYLNKAERIDAVNSTVRAARLRLLAAAALHHLQKKKPHLAAQRLAEIDVLPQSRQGDRPAFLDALRFLICRASGDQTGASQALLEVERVLSDGLAALIFVSGCAASAKRKDLVFLPFPGTLPEQQKSHLPISMARAIALAADIGLTRKFQLPIEYFDETEAQFPGISASLNVEQIRVLGDLGIACEHLKLAWAASAAGLDRGGSTEAYFLLLRAQALPEGLDDRYQALTAAAAELGRAHRDMEVVGRAVEAGRDLFDAAPLSLSADQARDVLRKEKESHAFPSRSSPGPDYSDLFPDDICMCPACCYKRGQSSDPDLDDIFDPGVPELDEDEMKRSFFEKAPKDIPREILPALFEVAKESFFRGEDPTEILSQILLEDAPARKNPPGQKKKKGRRG
jgi:uncharacterized protein